MNAFVEGSVLPRTIWMLWLQGWDDAPQLVKACVRTWERHNPGWRVRLLTAADLPEILDGDPALAAVAAKQLPPEAFSNLVRLGLLLRYGGVWADATTYCLRPLDSWIDEAVSAGFFGFANPGPDRMLSSWFMAAKRSQAILSIWQKYCVDYWNIHDERHIYFWFHGYLFKKAYEENKYFRDIWDMSPKISADGPHYFLPYSHKLADKFSDEEWERLLDTQNPLVKMTHKMPEGAMEAGRVVPYLIEKAFSEETSGHEKCPKDGILVESASSRYSPVLLRGDRPDRSVMKRIWDSFTRHRL